MKVLGSPGTFLLFFMKIQKGIPPLQCHFNMALFGGWLGGAVEGKGASFISKGSRDWFDAADGELHEKSWSSIFWEVWGRNYVKMIIQKLRFFFCVFF